MILTIIPVDNTVVVDGFAIAGFDLSSLPPAIHAVQWKNDHGHIEYTNGSANEKITDISFCKGIVAAHAAVRNTIENPVYTKDQAAAKMRTLIAGHKSILKNNYFSYKGNNYIYDIESIASTCLICLSMSPFDPIPTPAPIAGKWQTADVDVTGNPVFVTYTVADFLLFVRAMYDHGAHLWAAAKKHETTVSGMAAGSSFSAADITAYDFTGGW